MAVGLGEVVQDHTYGCYAAQPVKYLITRLGFELGVLDGTIIEKKGRPAACLIIDVAGCQCIDWHMT